MNMELYALGFISGGIFIGSIIWFFFVRSKPEIIITDLSEQEVWKGQSDEH